MKIAFFADTEHGMVAGFCRFHPIDIGAFVDEPTQHVIDVLECKTYNDAKRHQNILAGRDEDEGCDDFGDVALD